MGILQTRRHVPTREGGHKVKVGGHCKKIFPKLRAGERVPLHFQNRSGAYGRRKKNEYELVFFSSSALTTDAV